MSKSLVPGGKGELVVLSVMSLRRGVFVDVAVGPQEIYC